MDDTRLKDGPDIARSASLIGDPARANMLCALMSGKALTATELAGVAGVTAQTASSHLSRLVDGNMVSCLRQGRHRYYALASTGVADVLERLMGLAAQSGHVRTRTGPRDPEMRLARVCYDHLAGERGVALFDALLGRGHISVTAEDVHLTPGGADLMAQLGIEPRPTSAKAARSRRPLCRACLDWSQRRMHLGGTLGARILTTTLERKWAVRVPDSRVIRFTGTGSTAFDRAFGIS